MTNGTAAISIVKSQWRQGHTFLAAMLLALASALVPALFPIGASATRFAGSAFDPTTSAVALRARAQALIRTDKTEDQGLAKASAAPDRPVLPSRPAEATRPIALEHPVAEGAIAPAPRVSQRLITRAQPRAPPLSAI